jgi:hypothetical protein
LSVTLAIADVLAEHLLHFLNRAGVEGLISL